MTDLLSIASGSLLAYQRCLDVTGHNLANTDNQDYSRQEAVMTSQFYEGSPNHYYGTGVAVTDVKRISDDYLNQQLRNNIGSSSEYTEYYNDATNIDKLLSDDGTGITSTMNNFFSSLNAATNDPSYAPSRQAFLDQSQTMVNRFQTLDQKLRDQNDLINQNLSKNVDQVNQLASEIATVNKQIMVNGSGANDLYDQRDALLKNLSQLIGVTSKLEDTNGALNIFVGNGISLVLGGTANQLSVVNNKYDYMKKDLALSVNGTAVRIGSDDIHGGQISGMFDVQNNIIQPAMASLGRLALGIQEGFNAQHQKGMDLNGTIGNNFFTDINASTLEVSRVLPSSDNKGSAQLRVDIQDISKITDSDYLLAYDGMKYTLTNQSSGQITNFTSFPATVDGIQISLSSGNMATGDRFIISPTRDAAQSIGMSVSTVQGLALASPISVQQNTNNTGSVSVAATRVLDITNPSFATTKGALSPPLRIEFLTPTTYHVLNNQTGQEYAAGPFPYNPSTTNEIFPLPAVMDIPSSGLVNAGTLTALGAGDLVLNGVSVGAAADASASSTAEAINQGTLNHGVVATVSENTVNLGTVTAGAPGDALSAGQLVINGQDILVATPVTQSSIKDAINLQTTNTGVVATTDTSGHLVLTAQDGRNIQIQTDGSVPTASFSNFNLGVSADKVMRAELVLTRINGNIAVTGINPGKAGLVGGTTATTFDPGYRVSLEGTPSAEDSFVIDYNQNGQNDNRNGLALEQLQSATQMDNGTGTYQNVYGNLLVEVGGRTNQAQQQQDAMKAMVTQTQDQRNSLSGVNMDEEAANLLKLQQIYQGVSQMVKISRDMFAQLISVLGG